MTALEIIPAELTDLERYIDRLEEVASWLESRGIVQWRSGFFREATQYFAGCIEQGEVYLALLEGQFAGTLRLLAADPVVWPDVNQDGLYVHTLAVFRGWSRRGLGPRLLAWAEQQALARERAYLRLDCIASNAFLRRYYEEHGFVGRGERDVHFPQGTYHLARYEKPVGRSLTQS